MNWTSILCNFSTSCLKNNMHCKGHKSTSYQETSSCAKYCRMILTLQNTPVVNHSCPLLFQLLVHTTEKVSALIYMHWVFQHFSKLTETLGVRTMGSYSDPVKRENWLWRSFVCAGKIIGQRLLTCSFNQRYACIFLQVLLVLTQCSDYFRHTKPIHTNDPAGWLIPPLLNKWLKERSLQNILCSFVSKNRSTQMLP